MPNNEVYIKQIDPKCGAYALLYWYYNFIALKQGTVPVEVTFTNGLSKNFLFGSKHQADLLYDLIKCENALDPNSNHISKADYDWYIKYSNPYDIMMFCKMFGGKKVEFYTGPKQLGNFTNSITTMIDSPIKKLNNLLTKHVKKSWKQINQICNFTTHDNNFDISKLSEGHSLIAFCYLNKPTVECMHYVLIYKANQNYYGVNPWSGVTTKLDSTTLFNGRIRTQKARDSNLGYHTVYYAFAGIHIY